MLCFIETHGRLALSWIKTEEEGVWGWEWGKRLEEEGERRLKRGCQINDEYNR